RSPVPAWSASRRSDPPRNGATGVPARTSSPPSSSEASSRGTAQRAPAIHAHHAAEYSSRLLDLPEVLPNRTLRIAPLATDPDGAQLSARCEPAHGFRTNSEKIGHLPARVMLLDPPSAVHGSAADTFRVIGSRMASFLDIRSSMFLTIA